MIKRINKPVAIVLIFIILVIGSCSRYASRVGYETLGCLQECSLSTGPSRKSLRVISLNFFHGFPEFKNLERRLDIVSREIRDAGADIVFLQEVPWHRKVGNAAEFLAGSTGLNYTYVRANGNYSLIRFEEGLAIFSHYELHNPRFTEILPKPGYFENRAALAVTVRTPSGDINLVTTHLSRRADQETNAEQARSLKDFVDSLGLLPVIVAGDFNAVETSPQIRTLKKNWIDAWGITNPDVTGHTCCLGRDGLDKADPGSPWARVDYIFLVPNSSNWKVVESRSIFDKPVIINNKTQWASNHIGVMAEVRLQ